MSGFQSREKYDRQQHVFAQLRAKGTAANEALVRATGWRPWSISELGKLSGKVKTDARRIIDSVGAYMRQYLGGAFDCLSYDQIIISYTVFGNLRSPALLGEPSQGLVYKFEWDTVPVTVGLYTGQLVMPAVGADLMTAISTDGRDKSVIAKAVSWDRNACNALTANDVTTFVNMARVAVAGGTRFTRLIKGMLLYMELLEHGTQTFSVDLTKLIEYEPNTILNSYRVGGRSYAYCSQASVPEYVAILMLIGGVFPPPNMAVGCTVSVPADGDHYVVVRGDIVPLLGSRQVTLTASAVYGSMVKYAAEIGESDAFEAALICASSLYHNRYLTKVLLPSVVSQGDLLIPAFNYREQSHGARPHVTQHTLCSIGRLHQMQMLLIIKDMILAAYMSTSGGADYRRAAVAAITTYETIFLRHGSRATAMRLVEATPQMRWTTQLDADDLEDLNTVPMFECLWLSGDGDECLKDGGITAFKDARKDGNAANPYLRILREEIVKGGIIYAPERLPDGDFTIAGRNIGTGEIALPRRRSYRKISVTSGPVSPTPRLLRRNYSRQTDEKPRPHSPLPKSPIDLYAASPVHIATEPATVVPRDEAPPLATTPLSRPPPPTEAPAKVVRIVTPKPASVTSVPDVALPPTRPTADSTGPQRVAGVWNTLNRVPFKKWTPPQPPSAQPPPIDVMVSDERARQHGESESQATAKGRATMTERLAAHDAALTEAAEARKGTMDEPNTSMGKRLATVGIDHSAKSFRVTLGDVVQHVEVAVDRELTLDELRELPRRLSGVTLKLSALHDCSVILDSCGARGDMRSVRREGVSGTSYLYGMDDSIIMNVCIWGLRQSHGMRWLIAPTLLKRIMSEFNVSEADVNYVNKVIKYFSST